MVEILLGQFQRLWGGVVRQFGVERSTPDRWQVIALQLLVQHPCRTRKTFVGLAQRLGIALWRLAGGLWFLVAPQVTDHPGIARTSSSAIR